MNVAERPEVFDRTVRLTRHNAPFSCYSLVLQARDSHNSDQKILVGKANAVFLCTPKHCLLLNLPEEVIYLFLAALFSSLLCFAVESGRKLVIVQMCISSPFLCVWKLLRQTVPVSLLHFKSLLSLSLSSWRRISCVLSVCDRVPRQRTASDVTSVAFYWWYLPYDSLWCTNASGLHTCSQFLSYTLLSSSHSVISRGHTTVLLYPLRASLSSSFCHWILLIFYSIFF